MPSETMKTTPVTCLGALAGFSAEALDPASQAAVPPSVAPLIQSRRLISLLFLTFDLMDKEYHALEEGQGRDRLRKKRSCHLRLARMLLVH